MPSFVIVESGRIGETTDAILCDLGPIGFPDRRTDVPVRTRLVNERTLSVDDKPRGIISCLGENGRITYLIDGSTKGLRNRERRAGLARASALLQQLATCLRPLAAESEEPEIVTESLQQLFDWLRDERESATAAPRSIGAPQEAVHAR